MSRRWQTLLEEERIKLKWDAIIGMMYNYLEKTLRKFFRIGIGLEYIGYISNSRSQQFEHAFFPRDYREIVVPERGRGIHFIEYVWSLQYDKIIPDYIKFDMDEVYGEFLRSFRFRKNPNQLKGLTEPVYDDKERYLTFFLKPV